MTAGSPGKVGALASATTGWFFLVLSCGLLDASAEQKLATAHSETLPERGQCETTLLRIPSVGRRTLSDIRSTSLRNVKAVGAYREASVSVHSDRFTEETSHSRYPAGVGEGSQGDKSIQGKNRRSPAHILAHWRSSSSRWLSRPPGIALKRFVAAVLIVAAVVRTLLRGGRVFEARHGDEKLRHSTVTPSVEQRNVSFFEYFFVALVVLTVLSSALEAPTRRTVQTTHKRSPSVERSTDENGTTLVRIGRTWTDNNGQDQSGYSPLRFTWNGTTYEIYLSEHTLRALVRSGKRRVLQSLLHLPARPRDRDSGPVWVWGSAGRGGHRLFHTTRSSDGLKCEVLVPPEITEALQEGEAGDDFIQVVDTFLKNAVFPSRARSAKYVVEGGRDSSTASAKEGISKTVVARPRLAWTGPVVRATVPAYPPVEERMLVGGEKEVVGRDWNSEDGKRIQGYNPIKVTFEGRRFVLYLSKRTELYLIKRDVISGVRSALSRAPKRREAHDKVFWEWSASTPRSSIFFDGSSGVARDTHYRVYLPSGTPDWLDPNDAEPGASEAWNDLQVMLETVAQELTSPSDAPAPAGGMDGQQSFGDVHVSTQALKTHFQVPYLEPATAVPTMPLETLTTQSPVTSPETTKAPITSPQTPSTAPSAARLKLFTTDAPATASTETSTTGTPETASLEASTTGAPTMTVETYPTQDPSTTSLETSTTGAQTPTSPETFRSRAPTTTLETPTPTTFMETSTLGAPTPTSLETSTTGAPTTTLETPTPTTFMETSTIGAPTPTSLETSTTGAPTTILGTPTTGPPTTTSTETLTTGAPTTALETDTTGAPPTIFLQTSTTGAPTPTSWEPSTPGASTVSLETSPTAAPTTAPETPATEPPTVPVQAPTSQQQTFPATKQELNLDEDIKEVDVESLNLGKAEPQVLYPLYDWMNLPPLDLYTKVDGTRTWVVGRKWADDYGYSEVKTGKTVVRFKLDGETDFIVLLSEVLERALKEANAPRGFVNSLKNPPSTPGPGVGWGGEEEQQVHWGTRADPLGLAVYLSKGINYYFHVPQEVHTIFLGDRPAALDWSSLLRVTVKGIEEERKRVKNA